VWATYLLDADGHRRFGRFATGNFIYGFGAVQGSNDWIFRAQQACQQVWSSRDSVTFLGDGRLKYEFREDQILIKYLNPSRANREQNCLAGKLRCAPSARSQWHPTRAARARHRGLALLPASQLRQGVLLRFSKKTPVTMYFLPSPPWATGNRRSTSRCGPEKKCR